ncbi:MAG: hypothetical protein V9E84_03835 [Trichococcus flocculiformis]
MQEIYEFGKGFSAGTLLVGEHHYYSLEDEVTEAMQKDATHRQRGHQRVGSQSGNRRDGLDEDPLHRRIRTRWMSSIQPSPIKMRDDFYIVRSQDFLDGSDGEEFEQGHGLDVSWRTIWGSRWRK